MVVHDRLGFVIWYKAVTNGVFLPKYYDPQVAERLAVLDKSHNLLSMGSLEENGRLAVSAGHEIGKMSYGTGTIPFVRTSDISNWEIKTDPKQGVSEEVYSKFSKRQDVQAGDLLFVRDGTYLIGNSCMVTDHDLPCLIQSHILRLRLSEAPILNSHLLLAALSSPVVHMQIRSRQFTADIIDTIGNRYREILLPIPKDDAKRDAVAKATAAVIKTRARLREVIRKIPLWAQGIIRDLDQPLLDAEFENEQGNPGFCLSSSEIRNSVLLPKYYNPSIVAALQELAETHDLVCLSDLVEGKVVSWTTGIEIGKMAYDTGPVPFIRTSDISNWELKTDPKQNVSVWLYDSYRAKQDVRAEDIFIVRDGTYLVGSSCILTEHDTRVLFCGGLYKLRVEKKDKMDPYLLLAVLNMPVVRLQMRAKQFTRDIIDTLGKRIFEVVLPIPKDPKLCENIAEETRRAVNGRVDLRIRAKGIALEVEGIKP